MMDNLFCVIFLFFYISFLNFVCVTVCAMYVFHYVLCDGRTDMDPRDLPCEVETEKSLLASQQLKSSQRAVLSPAKGKKSSEKAPETPIVKC